MFDLSDPRTKMRVAVEADVSLVTLKRVLADDGATCRPSSVRRVREAIDRLKAADDANQRQRKARQ
jgi:hypothetical protein